MFGLQVFFSLTMTAIGISQSSSFSSDSNKAKTAAASIFAIIDRESKIDPSDESGTILEDVKGEIELHHVSFKYPSRPDVQVFRDLNLKIRAGKVSAKLNFQFPFFEAVNYALLESKLHLFYFLFSLSDCCSGWRKWEWEINSSLIVAKIL